MGRCPDKRTVELPGVGTTDWSTEDEVGLSSEEASRRFLKANLKGNHRYAESTGHIPIPGTKPY